MFLFRPAPSHHLAEDITASIGPPLRSARCAHKSAVRAGDLACLNDPALEMLTAEDSLATRGPIADRRAPVAALAVVEGRQSAHRTGGLA